MQISPTEADDLLRDNEWCTWADARELLIQASQMGAYRQGKVDEKLIQRLARTLEDCLQTVREYENSDDLLWMQYTLPALITTAKTRLGE